MLGLVIVIFLMMLVSCNVDPSKVSIVLNPGVDTVEVNSDFTDAGATGTVNDREVRTKVISNTVDLTTVGTYQIVYEVMYWTVTKQVTRMVEVIDETPPVGVLNPGIDTVKVGSTWTDAGIQASDNSLGDVQISVSGTVNTNIKGEYHVTYLLEDPSGNQTTVIRYVFVYE